MSIKDHVKRNTDAIMYYRQGLHELRLSRRHDIVAKRLSASLFNSLGVALHHQAKSHIPGVAQRMYTRSLAIAHQYKFQDVIDKVMVNSGRLRKRTDGGDGCAENIQMSGNII